MAVYGIVYMAINKYNGKKYIGQTIKTLKRRKQQHINSSFDPKYIQYNYIFHKAIRKYGAESFEWTIIDVAFNKVELNAKEQKYIKYFKSLTTQNGYNSTTGGDGCKFTKEISKKLSNKKKGVPKTEAHKKNMSKSRKKYLAELSAEEKTKMQKHLNNLNNEKKKCIEVFYNNQSIGVFESMRETERKIGISRRTILRILKGEKNQYKGYTFKYAN